MYAVLDQDIRLLTITCTTVKDLYGRKKVFQDNQDQPDTYSQSQNDWPCINLSGQLAILTYLALTESQKVGTQVTKRITLMLHGQQAIVTS